MKLPLTLKDGLNCEKSRFSRVRGLLAHWKAFADVFAPVENANSCAHTKTPRIKKITTPTLFLVALRRKPTLAALMNYVLFTHRNSLEFEDSQKTPRKIQTSFCSRCFIVPLKFTIELGRSVLCASADSLLPTVIGDS